jgi:hypothetical protein
MIARTSSISLYSAIARESLEKIIALDAKIDALKDIINKASQDEDTQEAQNEIIRFSEETGKLAAITIVFSAITIEAYIYDYAARHFSDSYVQNYVDKMDTVSKWVIVPRLITGRELPRDQRWFQLIKLLISERNLIVHSKSSSLPVSPGDAKAYVEKLLARNESIPEKAKQAVELLDVLVDKITEVDPEEAPWVKSYLA